MLLSHMFHVLSDVIVSGVLTVSNSLNAVSPRNMRLSDEYALRADSADSGGDVALSLYEPNGWPELLSPAQVAKLVNIQPSTVGRWCDQGTIEAVKIGRVWRIPQHAVWALVPPSIRAGWPDGPWKESAESER